MDDYCSSILGDDLRSLTVVLVIRRFAVARQAT